MADNFKHSGDRIPVATASGAIASGAFVVQEGFFGIALDKAAVGEALTISTKGIWYIAVPSGTVKGDLLYALASPATEDNAPTLTKTATSNTKVGRAVSDRDSAGKAKVLLLPQL